MPLAFSANAFRRSSLIATIDILHGIGYQGIEIMACTPHAYPPEQADAYLSGLFPCGKGS